MGPSVPGRKHRLRPRSTGVLYALLPVVSRQGKAVVEGRGVEGALPFMWRGDRRRLSGALSLVRPGARSTTVANRMPAKDSPAIVERNHGV